MRAPMLGVGRVGAPEAHPQEGAQHAWQLRVRVRVRVGVGVKDKDRVRDRDRG